MVVFGNMVRKFPEVEILLEMYMEDFSSLLDRELQLINTMKKSDYTEQIAEAAQRVDRTVIGMNAVIAAALHHFDPETVADAKSLRNRFDAFGGIVKKSYEEETVIVNLLIADLMSSEYAMKVNIVGLDPWLAELRANESAFEQLLERRNLETSEKAKGPIKSARQSLDILYHKMTDRVDAAATMSAANTYDGFIAQINAEITYFNNRYHHAPKNIAVGGASLIEPVDTQTFTGLPVTPLPKVWFREDGQKAVELVFAKDFFVTYKNNVEAGTATLVIHGKGGYKGQVSVKFNIVMLSEPK
jgi:hypothetical protein